MSTEINDYLSCTDLEIASLLLAKKYKLLNVVKNVPTKSIFYFSNKNKAEKEIERFYSGELEINALAFSNARKNLKSIIYSGRNF